LSARLTLPDGRGEAPVLDAEAFARLTAILADRGDGGRLPVCAPAEARGEPVPLAVIDLPDAFAAGLLLAAQFGRRVPALRSRSLELTLAGEDEDEVVVDLGDGAGPRPLAPGQSVAADLSSLSELQLTVSREGRVARCRVPIDDAPAPAPTETWTLPGGTGWVLPAPGHSSLRCPLVVVEGFPGGHGFLFSHDVLAQQGLLGSLQALGHDLVVVGLADGTRSLHENAAVVDAALARVSTETELPVTLLGWSMGGLLARIAVAAIERRGEAHRVETLLTWDTPHRGSMTQLGVQWFVANFASAHPAFAPYRHLLQSSANREMDMVVVGADGEVATDPLREALVATLAWPERPRRVLLASGRGDGACTLQPGTVLAHWHRGEHDEICLRAPGGAEPVAAGSLGGQTPPPLQVSGEPSWDGMPGGRETYVAQVATLLTDVAGGRFSPAVPPSTCTVPTVSALDLDGPPDAPVPARADLIACESDHPHLGIDAQAASRLLGALGAPFDPDRFDPHEPAFLADPFPTYGRFREFAPVHPVPAYESLWCFCAAECRTILQDTETWLKHPPGAVPVPVGPMSAEAGLPPGLFSSDPPAHPALRRAVELPLRSSLAAVPALARARAEQILQAIGSTERIELVHDYALPLPANVLFDLLGIAEDPVLRSTLIAWQQAITVAHDPSQTPGVRLQGATSAMALRGFFAALVQSHRRAPVPGLIGELCESFAAAGLSDAELEATLCDLLVAGYLSTTFVIATGLWRMLEVPGALASLRADPASAPRVVDELLRLDGPVQVIDRFASRPTTLAGQVIPAGGKATAVVGSADRDGAAFEAPEEFRPDRAEEHLAFGAGVHRCVGAPLAHLVAPEALGALLAFAPEIELDGEPQWQSDPYLRAVISLPLTLAAGAR
jgi:cytochrome P450